jgi:hypothetical protein
MNSSVGDGGSSGDKEQPIAGPFESVSAFYPKTTILLALSQNGKSQDSFTACKPLK